ncbi:MAG: GNAT family N-acetyltransferase [Candidatus Eremiobacteraeota bacterium]|nr:GNAT family N-acetyltransferase [Candidatus Eremiobacteraeota bacterium]
MNQPETPIQCTIRTAIPDDAPHILRLTQQVGYYLTERQAWEWLAVRMHDRDTIVAVMTDGSIVGMVSVLDRFTLFIGRQVEILDLVVDEVWRGREIGTALLNAAETWARQRGVLKVRLRTDMIRSPLRRFLARHGYSGTFKTEFFFNKEL